MALLEQHTPILATARLRLRAPNHADAPAITLLANNILVAENTSRLPHPYGLADAQAFITGASAAKVETTFAVTLADGTLIGMCGVAQLYGEDPEIGYWLGQPYWGQGYATEAARAVIDYAFEDLRLERLESGARVSNPASRRVLEKCGFQWTGVKRTRVRAIASSVPADRFRLDRSLWASFKEWGKVKRVA